MKTVIKEEFYSEDFELQNGDLTIDNQGNPYVVVNVGRDSGYRLIDMNKWDSVNEYHETLKSVKKCIIANEMQVFRNSNSTISVGDRIY